MLEGSPSKTLNMLGALSLALADRISARAEAASGLHGSAASAIVVIVNHPGEPVDALRRTLGITHSGAVRLIDGLEAAGLVERRRSERDGRVISVWPTADGEQTAARIIAARAELLEPVLAGMGDADRQTLAGLLEAALSRLTDSQERALRICRFCAEGECRPRGCPVEQAALHVEG